MEAVSRSLFCLILRSKIFQIRRRGEVISRWLPLPSPPPLAPAPAGLGLLPRHQSPLKRFRHPDVLPIGFRIAGKPDDPLLPRKATAIQRSTAIPDQWDFFNHEWNEFSRMGSGFAGESSGCGIYRRSGTSLERAGEKPEKYRTHQIASHDCPVVWHPPAQHDMISGRIHHEHGF